MMDACMTSTWVSAPHACLACQRRASIAPSLCAAAACRPLHTRLHVQGPCHAAEVPDSLPARARAAAAAAAAKKAGPARKANWLDAARQRADRRRAAPPASASQPAGAGARPALQRPRPCECQAKIGDKSSELIA